MSRFLLCSFVVFLCGCGGYKVVTGVSRSWLDTNQTLRSEGFWPGQVAEIDQDGGYMAYMEVHVWPMPQKIEISNSEAFRSSPMPPIVIGGGGLHEPIIIEHEPLPVVDPNAEGKKEDADALGDNEAVRLKVPGGGEVRVGRGTSPLLVGGIILLLILSTALIGYWLYKKHQKGAEKE